MSRSNPLRLLQAAACVLLAASAACALHAQSGADGIVAARPAPSIPGTIHVSGQWQIDVRNADGTTARHLEFENSLSDLGPSILADLLSGQTVTGGLGILAADTADGGACGRKGCILYTSGTGYTNFAAAGNICANLYTCLPTLKTAVTDGTITLTGSATAAQAGKLSVVGTTIGFCAGSTSQATACTAQRGASPYTFTTFTLPAAQQITLTAGQLVQFKVVLSFS